jgi:DNA polymerase-3 subunit delta
VLQPRAVHAADLVATVEEGNVPNVVLIVGAESFFIDRAVSALRKAVGEGGMGSLNEDIFEGRGVSAVKVLEAARTLPMLAAKRFVLVRDVGVINAEGLEKLAEYTASPYDSCCLVMTAEKLDGRSKLVKRATTAGCFYEALPLKERDVRGFVGHEARRRKLKIAAQAIDALVDSVGVDLPAIDDALERLSLFVGPGGAIDLPAVEACVTRVRSESIWALVDAVGLRDRKTALRATASLLADREPPLRILAMVARQLRMVARMKSALIAGASEADATRAAGAPPFKARELAQAARRLDAGSLSRAFGVLAETDLALKGSKRPPDVVLESAILALTR